MASSPLAFPHLETPPRSTLKACPRSGVSSPHRDPHVPPPTIFPPSTGRQLTPHVSSIFRPFRTTRGLTTLVPRPRHTPSIGAKIVAYVSPVTTSTNPTLSSAPKNSAAFTSRSAFSTSSRVISCPPSADEPCVWFRTVKLSGSYARNVATWVTLTGPFGGSAGRFIGGMRMLSPGAVVMSAAEKKSNRRIRYTWEVAVLLLLRPGIQ